MGRTQCSKCGGAGFIPDRCAKCDAAFDPRLLVGTAKELPCGDAITDLIEGEICECAAVESRPSTEYTIKDYRAAIRSLWLPIVARKKLNGAEMRFVDGLFEKGEPIEIVIQAIKALDERRRHRGLVVHSLGIIRADIEALKVKRARMGIGGQTAARKADEDWREEYEEALEELAEGVGNPELAAQYRELKRDLPRLSYEEFTARFREIK